MDDLPVFVCRIFKKQARNRDVAGFSGVGGGIRTHDLRNHNPAL